VPSIFTRLIARQYSPNAGDLLIFTVPSTDHYVLRHLVLNNLSNSEAKLQIYVVNTGLAYHLVNELFPAVTSRLYDLRQGVVPGYDIHVNSSMAGFSVWVTAYVFSG